MASVLSLSGVLYPGYIYYALNLSTYQTSDPPFCILAWNMANWLIHSVPEVKILFKNQRREKIKRLMSYKSYQKKIEIVYPLRKFLDFGIRHPVWIEV